MQRGWIRRGTITGLLMFGLVQPAVSGDRLTRRTRSDSTGAVMQEKGPAEFAGGADTGGADPDLEPGFPVASLHQDGIYHAGPAVHTCVANLDADSGLEIVATGLASGPLNAWNHDGTLLAGWPAGAASGAGYLAMGNLDGTPELLEVFSGHWDGDLIAYNGTAGVLPGWPLGSSNYVTTPGALADLDGDGIDELFVGEEDWRIHGYRADGSVLPGWPAAPFLGGQEIHTPVVADLDHDGDLEIVTASGRTTPGVYIFAHHHDATMVSGFPVLLSNGQVDTFLAVGDVDGDLSDEIVVVARQSSFPWLPLITILAGDGTIERTWLGSSVAPYGTAPALADLDGDTIPEILVQTDGHLEAWSGLGSTMPGWPVAWSSRWLGNSSPVAGDVTGDALAEIVVTTQEAGSSVAGDLRVFDSAGNLLPGFPKSLPLGAGAVPAIADVDADGRNEIIVTGSFWNGVVGFFDKLWVYDLGGGSHNPAQWSQFGGNSRHTGFFSTRIRLQLDGQDLLWESVAAASSYDAVRGDLETLRATGGDFAAATEACIANHVRDLQTVEPSDPALGEAYWFLVRATTALGHGSYDAADSQAGTRDPGLNASPFGCP